MRVSTPGNIGFWLAMVLLSGCRTVPPTNGQEMERLEGHLRKLSEDIGPRPVGSPAEGLARDYILRSFEEAGLQSRLDPVQEVRVSKDSDVLLDSANVIGVLPGKRPEPILVCAHHDSRNAACPGASDDASGVSVLLEAARRLAPTEHRHTLIFVSTTGEEVFGLPGSLSLATGWKGERPLAAITMDFVGTGKVFVAPFPESPELWANRLLSQAEAEERTGRVLLDPWLVVVPRVLPLPYGADHLSFLRAGIPAFNLSCQFPGWSYHTAEDRAARVDPVTLVATLHLVTRMIQILDREEGRVNERDAGYQELKVGKVVYLSSGMIRWIARVTMLLLAMRIGLSWRQLTILKHWTEAARSALLAVPFTALAGSGGFAVEAILAKARGVEHAWYSYPEAHLAGSFAAVALTVWLSLKLFRRVRPSIHSGVYLTLAILIQALLAGALSWARRNDLALPFWLGLAGMLAASWTMGGTRRLAWGALGVLWMLPFLSATAYRMFVELSGATLPPFFLEGALLAVSIPWFLFLQHLSCLPEVLIEARSSPTWRPATGGSLCFVAIGFALFNLLRPAYDENHRILVQVNETLDLGKKVAEATLASSESLDPVKVAAAGAREAPDPLHSHVVVPWEGVHPPELKVESELEPEGVVLRLVAKAARRVRTASLTIHGSAPFQVSRSGQWETEQTYRKVLVPASGEIQEEIHIRRNPGQRLEAIAELASDEDLLEIHPVAPLRVFRIVSRVRYEQALP